MFPYTAYNVLNEFHIPFAGFKGDETRQGIVSPLAAEQTFKYHLHGSLARCFSGHILPTILIK